MLSAAALLFFQSHHRGKKFNMINFLFTYVHLKISRARVKLNMNPCAVAPNNQVKII
jgi:hypothetical protein